MARTKGALNKTTIARLNMLMNVAAATRSEPEVTETDAEIEQKLSDRFEVLDMMTQAAIAGDARALIVSGPAGLGKSYTVEKALERWDADGVNHTIVKGYVRATALFKLLYQHRLPGQVLVFDDADQVFLDDTAINLLKAVCDTTDRRMVSYMTEAVLIDDESAERLPKRFEFEGTIIFITNLDFDNMIERGNKLAPHLEALVSRSFYMDLAMKTSRDYMIRIRQVVRAGLLSNVGLVQEAQDEVMAFVEKHKNRLRELSLRMVIKIAMLRRTSPVNWEKRAIVTCCKNV